MNLFTRHLVRGTFALINTTHMSLSSTNLGKFQQEAQLSQRDCTILRFIKYFAVKIQVI